MTQDGDNVINWCRIAFQSAWGTSFDDILPILRHPMESQFCPTVSPHRGASSYRMDSPRPRRKVIPMPELCRFAGIVIYLLFNDTQQHNKPHVHVYYGEYSASIGIDGELLAGSIPRKQFKIVAGWLALHEEEAYAAWNKAVQGEHFDKIDPM